MTDEAASCQWCGADVEPDATRCPECGRRVHTVSTARTASAAVPGPLPPLPPPPPRARRFDVTADPMAVVETPPEPKPPAPEPEAAPEDDVWWPPSELQRDEPVGEAPITATAPPPDPAVTDAAAAAASTEAGDQFVWPPPWMPQEEASPLQKSKRLRVVVGVGAVLAVALIAALIASQVAGDGRAEDEIKPTELQVGQCFNAPRDELKSVQVRPCTEDHQHEVFAVVDHPASENAKYPGDDEILRFAGERCIPRFEQYGSVPYEQANLADFEVVPTEESWKDGERRVICAVSSLDGDTMRGSVRGQRTTTTSP